MQNKIFRFNLDIKEKEFKTDFNLVQLDNTSMLVIKLFDEGNKLETTKEDRAEIAIDKNDNTFCVLPCNLYDNEVNCTLDSNALASPGWTNCEVRILNEGKILTSARFKIYIRENIVNNEKIKSTTEYKALDELINEAKSMQESLKKGETVIEDVNKIKNDLTEIKESILNKSKEIDSNLAVADEKINLIKTYISKSETAINNLANNQNKIDSLSNLLKELEKIKLTLDELNESVNKANTKKTELDTSIENANREKTELDSSVENAKTQNTNLKNTITEAETAESSLATSTQKGISQQSNLEKTIADSVKKNKILSDTNTKSETLNTDLNVLSQDLTNKITDGGSLNSNLATSISDAGNAKRNLDESISNAESTNTSLKATDTEAKNTESLIRDLMNKLNTTEDEVKQIIASGNLEKYVTDPKLQEVLKAYATKKDLATVDVTSQLQEYAKKSELDVKADKKDLPKKLSELENDKEFQTLNEVNSKIESTVNGVAESINANISADLNKKIDKTAITDDFEKQSQDKVLSQKGAYDLWSTANNTIQTKYMECIRGVQALENLVNEKPDASDIPTKLSQLTNDENFKTEAEIQTLINNSTKLKKEIVTSLPSTGKEDVIYLLKNKNDTNNFYTEYMWIGGKWEIIGDTKVDLTGYAKKSDIKTKLSEMSEDSTHRVVTDDEKAKWNKKFELPQGKENQVLTKTSTGAEFKEISSSRSATFVIANYDSSENSKAGADYVIQESDCAAEIINGFITKLPEYGGKIQLTEGNFNIKKDLTININKNNIIIEGYGDSTNIIDKLTKDERNLIIIYIPNEIKNCRLSDLNISHETSNAINIYGNNNYIKNVNVTNNGDYPSLAIDNDASKNILENCSVKCDGAICYSFGERTQSNTILNCSGTSSKKLSFLIRGSNYRLLNCSGTSTNDMAFYIDGSHHQFSNCSGTSSNGMAFYIDGSHHQFSNCSGTSSNGMAFYVKGLYHTILNCSGTSTNNTTFYVNGSQISVIGCFGESKKPDKFFDVLFGSESSKCIMLGTYCGSAQFANRGTNNISANNIIIK